MFTPGMDERVRVGALLAAIAEKKGVSYRTLCEDILDGEGLAGEKNPYY